jgi:hypothetical protein
MSSVGTGTISPTSSVNNTCPVTIVTLTSFDTKYNTMIVTTTIYVANLTTMADPFTKTVTDFITETDTMTETDFTKTKTKIEVVSTVTDNQVSTVTEIMTIFATESGQPRYDSWWQGH